MGCCFSTPQSPKQQPNPQAGFHLHQSHLISPEQKSNATHEIDKRPPPPPLEEETVKEVLSETPISKPQVSILVEERSNRIAQIEPRIEKFEAKPKGVVENVDEVPEVSEISEICSINESFSTTTTTSATTTPIAEEGEDEATSKRLNQPPSNNVRRKHSCSVDSSDGRERRPKSPVRRSEPSPEKKKSQGITRSARGREPGQMATRKHNVGPGRVRRNSGEASGRRSNSPSTRPVSATGGRSQVKPRAKPVENSESEKAGEKNDDFPPDPQESLDNPLVSLECFIFL